MAQLGETINAAELPASQGFDPIPAGWYSVTITGAEVRDTKAGTGSYIAVRYDVTGPTHEGRVIFGNLNIRNPNPKAEEIGRQQLGDLMRAIGLASVTDTDQLIGGRCQIKVAIQKSDEYGDRNDVKSWRSDGSPPSLNAQSAETKTQENATAPPWARTQ